MFSSFSLAFLLSGLPILFAIREYVPMDKQVFTYLVITIILFLLPDYKAIVKNKIHTSYPIVSSILFSILLIFLIVSVLLYGFNEQTIYLGIVLYIFINLLFLKGKDLTRFFYWILIISSISIIIVYALTPTDFMYWATKGGRLYVGDTKNPNLISWISAINIIAIIYMYLKTNYFRYFRFMFLIVAIMALHLLILSFSKSSAIGLLLIILFYLLKTKFKILYKIKYVMLLTLSILVLVYFFQDTVMEIGNLLFNAALTLLGFNSQDNLVMSASVRNEHFEESFALFSLDNIFGLGMNSFRMDSPILQAFLDFGNVIGGLFFIISIIYPIVLIKRRNNYQENENLTIAFLLYLFFFPNLFFHGTPYEYWTWLPLLIFYRFIGMRFKSNESYSYNKHPNTI